MSQRLAILLALMSAVPVAAPSVSAQIRPHGLFTDGAVLQRGVRIPVFGRAPDGEDIVVSLAGVEGHTTASGGRFLAWLPPLEAGGPHLLTIRGSHAVEVRNVLIGEVWICSGQSNMQWPLRLTDEAEKGAAEAADPLLRLFTVPSRAADLPERDVDAAWSESSPETAKEFSAVGFWFGRSLRTALGCPVGLIDSSYGGTPAEAWTRHEVLEGDPGLAEILKAHAAAIRRYPEDLAAHERVVAARAASAETAAAGGRKAPPAPRAPVDPAKSPGRPSGLWNAMVAPLVPFAIRGAIWYQGESNASRARQYRRLFPAMIRDWRAAFGQGDFPFLFVQLAPFMARDATPGETSWAALREAQLMTARDVRHAGMAVITDVGDPKDIHPRRKETVGDRLARLARAMVYGEAVPCHGPLHAAMVVEGDSAVLSFQHAESGLEARGGPLAGFEVAGEDRRFVPAAARIEGAKVIVRSPDVKVPVAVRYGWSNCPDGNLWNRDGLPASPFRTDDFEGPARER